MFRKKRCFLLLSALIIVFSILGFGFVSAVGVTLTNVNSTYAQIKISDASNLYAYEVNFDYTGSAGGVDFSGFLGAGTSTGTSDSGSIYTVYESRLDDSQTGISGSGELFNVTHDGSFSLRFALFVAADGTDETVYYNTSAEATTTTVSESGGGGGALIPIEDVDIIIVTFALTVNLIVGEEETREIVIKNIGEGVTLDVVIEGDELIGLIDAPNKITLNANEEKRIEIIAKVEDRGLIVGKILLVYSGEIIGEVLVIINVRSRNFLFDSSVSLLSEYRKIVAGNNLRVQINLLQVGPQEKVDVIASYVIKDFFGTVYFEEIETFFVLGSKDFVKEFSTEDLPPGKYIVGMEIVYPGAFATSSAQFQVEERQGLTKPQLTILGLVIIFVILIFLILLFFIIKSRGRLRRRKSKKRRKR